MRQLVRKVNIVRTDLGIAHLLVGMESYELKNRIGKGNFGQVYRAINKDSGEVAVKIIDLEEAVDEIEDIQAEINILKQLKCDHITGYYDSFVKKSKLWLIMEYCEISLSDLMKVSPLDEIYAAIVVRDVLKGLEYLHSEGKLHRDIKAANILINKDGIVKICDFGVSGQTFGEKRSTFVGSPMWMAPEVIKESGYDEKADIWSLGITAIEIVKGIPPYSDINPMQLLFMIPKSDPPTLTGDFSKAFKDFVAQCLQKDPGKRPSAKDLLKTKWIRNAKKPKLMLNLIKEYQRYLEKLKLDEEFDTLEWDDKNLKSSLDDDWNFGTIQGSKIGKNSTSEKEPPVLYIPPAPDIPKSGWKSMKIVVDDSNKTFKQKKSVFETQKSLGTSNATLNQDSFSVNYIDSTVAPTLMNYKHRVKQNHLDILLKILETIEFESPGVVQEIFRSKILKE